MSAAAAFERAGLVADAVLYEGYVLYPYRASATKNQVRWQFGVLAPQRFAEADGSEQWDQQTEVIAELSAAGAGRVRDRQEAPRRRGSGAQPPRDDGLGAKVDVCIRFLQVQARTIEVADGEEFTPVAQLDVDGERWTTWEEAIEHAIDVTDVDLATVGSRDVPFTIPASRDVETLGDGARIVRERWTIDGLARIDVANVPGPYPLTRLRVRVENVTGWGDAGDRREDVTRRSLVGVHVLLHASDGSFLSSLDPPEFASGAVASCTNRNAFPVLIGDDGDNSTVLSSPIILYDRPEVADESQGDMCDATEIDEILALRVLTLTDDEKRDARATDPRAAAIVDRVDDFAPEIFERLHGAIRSLHPAPAAPTEPEATLPWWEPAVDASVDPWSDVINIDDVDVQKGSKVKLRPGHRRTDAQDLFLIDRIATVEGVFSDVDGDQHVAVSLDDDPAAELHQWYGRFLYFHPDEVEPVR